MFCYDLVDAVPQAVSDFLCFFLVQETDSHITACSSYDYSGNAKKLIYGTFCGLQLVEPFDRHNVSFGKQVAFVDIDAFFIDPVPIAVIAEIRTDQHVYQYQKGSGKRGRFCNIKILWEKDKIVDSSKDRKSQDTACGSGDIHAFESLSR